MSRIRCQSPPPARSAVGGRGPSVIHVLDVARVRGESLDRYLEILIEEYLPGARQRGLRVEGVWRSPPAARALHRGEPAVPAARRSRLRAAGMIHRIELFAVGPDADAGRVERLETALLEAPRHTTAERVRLGRSETRRHGWTHVWEQD